jgi:hypothetical protein
MTIETGIAKVAPWHPDDDAELMVAAPGRWTSVVPFAASEVLRPVTSSKATPVVEHTPLPPDAVIVPFAATLTSVTAKAFGFETWRITSALPPGCSIVDGLSPPESAVTVTGCIVEVLADEAPCPCEV